MNLYERIRKTRKAKGFTQTDLAEKSGYADKSMIARIENGQIDIALSKLENIADALNVDPAYLMGWTDDALIEDIEEAFKELNDEGKEKICEYARDIVASGKYKKHDSHDMVSAQ